MPTDKVKEVTIDGTMVSTPTVAEATTPRSQLNFFRLGYTYQYTDASGKLVTMSPEGCPAATPDPAGFLLLILAMNAVHWAARRLSSRILYMQPS